MWTQASVYTEHSVHTTDCPHCGSGCGPGPGPGPGAAGAPFTETKASSGSRLGGPLQGLGSDPWPASLKTPTKFLAWMKPLFFSPEEEQAKGVAAGAGSARPAPPRPHSRRGQRGQQMKGKLVFPLGSSSFSPRVRPPRRGPVNM